MKHPLPRRSASGVVLALALSASWILPASAQTSPPTAPPVSPTSGTPAGDSARAQQFTLSNGMTLIVKPDRRSPTAVHMVWVRVGAMDEVDGTSGVAHALEHMMFKGTKRIPPGEFSRQVAALGGQENAFTSRDLTGYYQQIPAGKLEDVMKIEADRFADNQWPDAEFKREIEVIKEERRLRTEDQPRALLGEQQNAAVFMASPYHRPIVGWMSDLDAMTPDDVRDFHASGTCPPTRRSWWPATSTSPGCGRWPNATTAAFPRGRCRRASPAPSPSSAASGAWNSRRRPNRPTSRWRSARRAWKASTARATPGRWWCSRPCSTAIRAHGSTGR